MVISGIATVGQLQIGNPDNSLIGITTILDEDDMVSNSDTALATQQSIKAYVDNEIGNVADTDTTYDLSTNDPGTGNVNIRLTGSDSTTDDVLVSAGTNITLSENGSGTGFTINATSTTFTPNAGYAHTAGISTYTSEWTLGANGINDYTFTGPGLTGAEADPKIYLVRGQQYKFTNNMNAHPFRIQSTANGSAGTQYNDGIVNNDIQNGTLTWNVQFDTPSTLYYQCTAHPNMGGEIVILDAGSGDTNTTYDLETEADGNDIKIKLVGSDSTTGIVTISAGNNITLTDNGDSFTIDAASGSGGSGTLTDVDVKQFSDNSTPRTEYGCSNPIEVTIAAGIATIGIGTTSNAYGKRYYSTTEPTQDVCDGDIWYDPSNGGSGSSGSSGITDGDKGDITVSNSGQTWSIDNDTIGPDELQDTSVTAGSYTNADITVDAQGRITAAASGAFVGLTDTPSSLTADKWLKVNSSGNALEFVDEPSGGSGGSSDPVGTIVAWAGSVANIPSEYQLCDGSAASTSALQAITGSNVPNLTDRFIIGANDVAAESAYPGVGVGSTGGSANSVVASHSHGTYGSESGYRHAVRAGTDASIDWDSHTASSEDGTYSSNSRTDTSGVDSDGNSDSSQTGTNANLPPYYALCYIIKHTATSGSGGSGGSGFVLREPKTTTGSPVEFTDIPADAYEITLMFNDVSLDGSGSILVELGTSNGYITSGYTATSQTEDGANDVTVTNAFTIYSGSNYLHHGKFDINKFSDTSYTFEGQSRTLNNGGVQAYGSLNGISGTITKLKIRPANTGSGVQFDSGSFGLSYKTSGSGGDGGVGIGSTSKIIQGNTEAEVVDTGSDGHFKVTTEGTERLRVTPDGFVGIGSTMPAGVLDINSTTGDANVYIRTFSNNVGNTQILFGDSDKNDSGKVQYNHPGDYMVFHTNSSEQVRITSNGSVGIGTTNPTATLDVNGKVALGSSVYDSNGNTGTSGQVLSSVPGIGVSWTDQTGGSGGSGGGSSKIAILSDVKTAGTNGGDFDTGAWRNRELNTELDPESFVTLNSSNNYFELGEGSYRISWSAPAHAVDMHQTRLTYANNTSFTSSSEVYGTSEACFDPILEGNNNIQTRSFGETIITITETTYFKIQHRCQDSKSGSGFGLSKDFGSEGTNEAIYTQVIIQDLNSGGGSGGGGEPVGTIIAWGGSTASIPTGYQLCDGGAAESNTLQAITGANVPDLRDRFIVGAGNNYSVDATGGSANAILVSHNHGAGTYAVTGGNHTHGYTKAADIDDPNDDGESGNPSGSGGLLTGGFESETTSGTGAHSHTISGSSATVGKDNTGANSTSQTGTNANLPPYYALCYIIKHTATSGSGGSGGGTSDVAKITAISAFLI